MVGARVNALRHLLWERCHFISESMYKATLEATQGQMDGFFRQLPYICDLEEVASVGDCLQSCPQFDSRVGTLDIWSYGTSKPVNQNSLHLRRRHPMEALLTLTTKVTFQPLKRHFPAVEIDSWKCIVDVGLSASLTLA